MVYHFSGTRFSNIAGGVIVGEGCVGCYMFIWIFFVRGDVALCAVVTF